MWLWTDWTHPAPATLTPSEDALNRLRVIIESLRERKYRFSPPQERSWADGLSEDDLVEGGLGGS